MQVRIYDIDDKDNETFRAQCELRDCFPDDDSEFEAALDYLCRVGRYYAGGGAAPLTLLMLADREARRLIDGGAR